MHPFRSLGRLGSGVAHLATVALFGLVGLFSAALDFMLGIVARLYDRFDAGWDRMARETRVRRAREGQKTIDPITLERDR